MHTHGSNEFRPARKSWYSIPDVLNKGLELILQPDTGTTTGMGGQGVEETGITEEDVLGDL
jgi:hypothetical protein